ncbi:hypothetical protein BH18ACI4_BH18ACI4_01470 [soil metagenome]
MSQRFRPDAEALWAAMLFNEGDTPPEIVRFLRGALNSDTQAKVLAEIVGPHFADFKARVNAAKHYGRRAQRIKN